MCCAVHAQTLYVMYCLRSNRRISYCCSVLGSTQTPIDLPLTSPFYLIAYDSKVCQLVRGAQSSLEYIFYETEYSTFMTKNDYGGAHPYGVTRDPQGQMIFYCYYRRELQFIFWIKIAIIISFLHESTSKKIEIFSTNRKLQNDYNFCIISYNLLFIIMISPLCLDGVLWIQNNIISFRRGKKGKLSWRQNNDAFPPFRNKLYSIQIPSCDVPREQKNAEPGNKNLLKYEARGFNSNDFGPEFLDRALHNFFFLFLLLFFFWS